MHLLATNIPATLTLSGELSFATAASLYKKGCRLIAAHPKIVFDLRQVTTSDNSGIALLITWTRYTKMLKKSIKFINPPAQLMSMLKLTNLQKLLPIEMGENKF